MKKMERIRTAMAVLLLSVVLPMTLVVPFHHHEVEESSLLSCELCEHHQPHAGHLTSAGHLDTCLVCQFLGNCFLPEESFSVLSAPVRHNDRTGSTTLSVPTVQLQLLSTRAPPVSSC